MDVYIKELGGAVASIGPVSYTHLDVYKRQAVNRDLYIISRGTDSIEEAA